MTKEKKAFLHAYFHTLRIASNATRVLIFNYQLYARKFYMQMGRLTQNLFAYLISLITMNMDESKLRCVHKVPCIRVSSYRTSKN